MPDKNPKELSVTMGADPEFHIKVQETPIDAKTILVSLLGKTHKATELGFVIEKAGEIGWDGHAASAELRPIFSKNPLEVADRCKTILQLFHEKAPGMRATTTSEAAPIGGHIHVGNLPAKWNSLDLERFHKAIVGFCIPILMSEDPTNTTLRGNTYGGILDYRLAKRGNDKVVYEFRIPNAEWLTSKKITEAVLSFIGVIAHEIATKGIDVAKDIAIPSAKVGSIMVDAAVARIPGWTNRLLNNIKRKVRSFSMYKEFEEECELAMNPEKMIELKRKFKYDPIEGWDLRNPFLNQDIKKLPETVKKAAKTLKLAWNGENNIQQAVCDVAETIMAEGYPIQGAWFVYGTRLPAPIVHLRNAPIGNKKTRRMFLGEELIKTVLDANVIDEVASKMDTKWLSNDADRTIPELHFTLGLPKDLRNKEEILKIIKEVEIQIRNKNYGKTITELIKDKYNDSDALKLKKAEYNDENETYKKAGECWKLYNRRSTDPEPPKKKAKTKEEPIILQIEPDNMPLVGWTEASFPDRPSIRRNPFNTPDEEEAARITAALEEITRTQLSDENQN